MGLYLPGSFPLLLYSYYILGVPYFRVPISVPLKGWFVNRLIFMGLYPSSDPIKPYTIHL